MERARRRLHDLEGQGESPTLDEVLEGINRRDERDAAREVGPLRPAPDANHVFTDGLSPGQVLDRLVDLSTRTGLELIRRGADVIWAGDDFGTQAGMLMAPAMWRRLFKPRIHGMFEAFRSANPDIKLAWHSCGSIVPIVPDFIEIGLDILNPIQPRAAGMEPRFLKREYGRDLVFFGGLDIQELLPRGTPQQVKDEVRRLVAILGSGGGYILAPAHNVQDDTPTDNILAVFEGVRS